MEFVLQPAQLTEGRTACREVALAASEAQGRVKLRGQKYNKVDKPINTLLASGYSSLYVLYSASLEKKCTSNIIIIVWFLFEDRFAYPCPIF
jgi:hypothetical protein